MLYRRVFPSTVGVYERGLFQQLFSSLPTACFLVYSFVNDVLLQPQTYSNESL